MAKKKTENTNPSGLDLTEDRLFPLSMGIFTCAVCAPKSWDANRIGEQVARDSPPGTSLNRWVVSSDQPKEDTQCPDDVGRIHVLLNC